MLSYSVRTPANVDIPASIDPLYGINFEGIFPISDFDVNIGFRFNLPSNVSSPEGKVTEATISGPYINISKKVASGLFGNRNLDLSLGGGANFSFYSGQLISIIGSYGYQFYGELLLKTDAQNYMFRLGYMLNNGRGSNLNSYHNAGYFLTGGLVYKL